MSEDRSSEVQQESLSSTVTHLLEECRMVLPGIQALFGFQLMAVFNQVFWEKLTESDQRLHLLALGLVALAVAFVMTPAAYHRQAERTTISRTFVTLSSRFLLWSMPPLMTGMCLDFYLIGKLVLRDSVASSLFTLVLFTAFVVPWFLVPRIATLKKWLAADGRT
jgi:uncharacterized protein DUF6328